MNWQPHQDALARLAALLPAGVSGRLLCAADADTLAGLRFEVVSRQLADPNCYRLEAESPDFPASHLGQAGPGEKGVIAGLFDTTGVLIGYAALTLPGPGEPSRADLLNLPSAQRSLVAYLASAMVRADWQKHGLHHALVEWRLILAGALGRRHAVSAVWPGNHQSWGHLVAHGLRGKKLARVEKGLLRLVVHRDLLAPPPLPDPLSLRLIPLALLADQMVLFDEGYWLWRRLRPPDHILAELARPLPEEGQT
ncbi:MAG: GNAT family N-acetyltransferase [Chromatiaceae bacterium]|nr:GNAT family N-acetyltransferase [Chromatiaceae bacterium]